MKKIIFNLIFLIILLMFINLVNPSKSEADWWTRPDVLPTQPSTPRNLVMPTVSIQPTGVPAQPTPTPELQPTRVPAQPTPTPELQPTGVPTQLTITPRIGGEPTVSPAQSAATGGEGGSADSSGNPCDPGKSYIGPYCGWSPNTNGNGGGNVASGPRIGGGPQVLGLSNTSGREVAWSDIIMLAGVLCLALYARSKLITENKSH